MDKLFYEAIIFSISSLFAFFLLKIIIKQKMIHQRIHDILPVNPSVSVIDNNLGNETIIKKFQSLAQLFKNLPFRAKTEKLLLEAGSILKPEEFFALRMFIVSGIVIFLYVTGEAWYFTALACIIGYFIPELYLRYKRKKRLHLLSYQLIEALGMMANSMRAGFSFMQALRLIGRRCQIRLALNFNGLYVKVDWVFH